ncbi:MAG: carbamoyl-phosphate synthase (glutamine-hydrolyzing) large subunit [Clostridia bacterium]|nr:carbamoyl-phosphate synthase (glutamine-hydrolyzing) large subunit [Clostridia bacterium]MBN2884170.1 carbamoyl-phosphate synthase (glutamine-hydrolyzing) large subunit [Clostridia bacterium]
MPKRADISKVLVIGSGPIIIGQAAEFDYSGSQACRALREEGVEVVLVNSNPATIMTDMETADKVYIEPLSLEYVRKIIIDEKPDGLLASLGGQTGLNMALSLAEDGILDEMGVELLGTSLESIKKAEDRELFRDTMISIGEKVAPSAIVNTIGAAGAFAEEIGYPVIVRPAFTMGGSGGGIAANRNELEDICSKGLKLSVISQVLIEKSVAGWKEIEYEVMRDGNDNCITVCNMENFDPVGIHTGDSIVVAPSQTLSDKDYQLLRSSSLKIIRALDIKGGCNIQFALDPHSFEYIVIEVNPRVSRSSALASKATGYPIARSAAKIAIGLDLDEIKNPITGNTYACFEPSLDYVVVKVPRWPFDKFKTADRSVGTQMKATGEVMAIGRNFEEALLKAIDSLDIKLNYQLGLQLFENTPIEQLMDYIMHPKDETLFAIFKLLQKGISTEKIHEITKIDMFFLAKLKKIVDVAEEIQIAGIAWLDYELYLKAKKVGFGDSYIANLVDVPLARILELREKYPIKPVYKLVDTCAGEFEAVTPYYYSTYEQYDDIEYSDNDKVLVIGSGPIRIGQGIEFDYCSVHSVEALREMGIESVIINNNPETVSTDFDISDKLYFDPLTEEGVLDIIEKERPLGVILQFGGQTSINLAHPLHKAGVKILGTPMESIDLAENRNKFLGLLDELEIPIPRGKTAFSFDEARIIASEIGFPVLVRPSYVLGGRAMEIVYDDKTLEEYMAMATDISPIHPILIDKYIMGKEIEVDGICDGKDVLIPGIMEHIERAGVHSGDSIAVYPAITLSDEIKKTITDYSMRLAISLGTIGLFNIQFVIDKNNQVYVIEVNPRASRTIPVLSKITGIPMVNAATQVIMGKKLSELGYGTGLAVESEFYAVKAPVFSFSKITTLDTFLGPEMKSTGEVMGVSKDYREALYKALLASGLKIPSSGKVIMSITDRDKNDCLPIASALDSFGYSLIASVGTADFLNKNGLFCETLSDAEMISKIKNGSIALMINTPTRGKMPGTDGFALRRTAIEYNVPSITNLDTAGAILSVLDYFANGIEPNIYSLDSYSHYSGKKI